jgi:hypothetical protein
VQQRVQGARQPARGEGEGSLGEKLKARKSVTWKDVALTAELLVEQLRELPPDPEYSLFSGNALRSTEALIAVMHRSRSSTR